MNIFFSAVLDHLKFLTSSFGENFFIVLVSLIPCKWVQMTYPRSIEFTMSIFQNRQPLN